MKGFPPLPDKVVNDTNQGRNLKMRWALQHTRELVPTRKVRRGGALNPRGPLRLCRSSGWLLWATRAAH